MIGPLHAAQTASFSEVNPLYFSTYALTLVRVHRHSLNTSIDDARTIRESHNFSQESRKKRITHGILYRGPTGFTGHGGNTLNGGERCQAFTSSSGFANY